MAQRLPTRCNPDDRLNLKGSGRNDDRGLVLEFSGVDISYTPEGAIDPTPPQVQEYAYRVASYIANRIYAQTSFEVIAPDSVLMKALRVLPETSAEEAEFRKTPRRMWTSINLCSSIRGTFDPVRRARKGRAISALKALRA